MVRAMNVTEKPKRSTVYLDPELHHALKVQAVETSRNISEIINSAVRDALREDHEDLATFRERATEPKLSFEELLKRLNLNGKI